MTLCVSVHLHPESPVSTTHYSRGGGALSVPQLLIMAPSPWQSTLLLTLPLANATVSSSLSLSVQPVLTCHFYIISTAFHLLRACVCRHGMHRSFERLKHDPPGSMTSTGYLVTPDIFYLPRGWLHNGGRLCCNPFISLRTHLRV